MNVASSPSPARGFLRAFLHEREAATTCIDEIHAATAVHDRARVAAAVLSLSRACDRAAAAIGALAELPTGGGSARFCGDELAAVRRDAACAVVGALTRLTAPPPPSTRAQPAPGR